LGHGLEEGVLMGPLVSSAHRDKVESYIKIGIEEGAKLLCGGKRPEGAEYAKGNFVEPTIFDHVTPNMRIAREEIFGPVLTIYTYPDADFEKVCSLVDSTSDYALTGAVFSQDRYALQYALKALSQSAGNFYINDKPTGAVVGQQPFGGARASGTNDKAGSMLNLYRWLSARTIKETLNPVTDYRYSFLNEK
jgi:1-pyrroline-5-carboxylate dehydrogenase